MTKERITRKDAVNLLAKQLRDTDRRDGYKTESLDFYQAEAQIMLDEEIKHEPRYADHYYIWREGRRCYKEIFEVKEKCK